MKTGLPTRNREGKESWLMMTRDQQTWETLSDDLNVSESKYLLLIESFRFLNLSKFFFVWASAKFHFPAIHWMKLISPVSNEALILVTVGRRRYSLPSCSVVTVEDRPWESTVSANERGCSAENPIFSCSDIIDPQSVDVAVASISAPIEEKSMRVCFQLNQSMTWCNSPLLAGRYIPEL